MPSIVNLQALGLNSQPNQLSIPDGSLNEASNIIIKRDNVIESRRGYKLDGDTFGTGTDTLKQLFIYKERILRHYLSTLQFEDGLNNDGSRKFTSFSGSYSETETGLRMKSIEANGNFYFTTSNGIKKISASSASNLSGSSNYITNAGGVKAIDITASLNVEEGNQTGFLPEDSAVAYRHVWGTKDANNNLILGSPSQRAEVYNSLTSLLIGDFNTVLGSLDKINQSGSLITDGTYVSTLLLDRNSTAANLQTNIISLASKIDNDILYATDLGSGVPLTISSAAISSGVCTITFSSGNPTNYFVSGSNIYLAGFVATTGSINGIQSVTGVTASTITFNTTATGPVTVTSTSIVSYEYRYIVSNGDVDYPDPLTTYVLSTIPTNNDLKVIQDTLDRIIIRLQSEPVNVISNALSLLYITNLDITTTATTMIDISIPSEVTSSHFFQVYRSSIAQATGTTVLSDLTPDDEMQLVYEAYPTAAELSARSVTFEDITPDAFRGAFLYTNEATGEGAAQANDIPPFAKDISAFKNSTFFANTKTRHKKLLSLLGVSNMISDYGLGTTPKLTIASATGSNTYSFVVGVAEISRFTAVADVANSLNGKYFLIYSAQDAKAYYVWFKTSGGVATDPALAGKTGIKCLITTGDTAATVATKIKNTVSVYVNDFLVSNPTSTTVQIENTEVGYTTNSAVGTSGFTVSLIQSGLGENITNKEILLASDTSPAIAVDKTARSIVKVVNGNSSESVYVYYLSGANTVPGQMVIESRTLVDNPFYLLGNNLNTGASFNPTISPSLTISAIATGGPTANLITTSTAHGMITGDKVVINSTTTTPNVDGLWSITFVSTTTFRINTTITVGDAVAPVGVAIPAADAEISSNETSPNRVYYSKTSQPEAVPILNYFDVGALDKEILRIFPLRDSLFVFKEDGLFRISGESAPFSLTLFDGSYKLLAPDSLALCNNEIYGWSGQGICKVNEGSTSPPISRPIDIEILKLATSQYTNFTTATFGVGYESDNSYIVWTVTETTDTIAQIAYRYSTQTNSWTTFDKTNTCGIISSVDDKMYLGAGDINSMEQERKEFSRYDYADREYTVPLVASNYFGTQLRFSDLSNMEIGDVLVQNQTVTIYHYNVLLQRLDADTGINDTDYYSTLQAVAGDNMRTKLLALATKLDSDTGVSSTDYAASIANLSGTITSITVANPTVVTTSSPHGLLTHRYINIVTSNSTPVINGNYSVTVTGASAFTVPVNVRVAGTTATFSTNINSFVDLKACFNIIIDKLNVDTGVSFSNYQEIDTDTIQEVIITDINTSTKLVTVNTELDFIVGNLTLYKGIQTTTVYSPQTMGDPLGYKQIREATMMFENKAFTNATLSFATDLLPEFIEIPFNGDGNGIFGSQKFGNNFFGGNSHGAPFRTWIPRNCQRCRYIETKFEHRIARERYAIFGVTLTGEVGQSSRAYRG